MADKIVKQKVESFNIQNEQVILANMIKSNKTRRKLSKALKESYWLGQRHRTIFKVLKGMAEKNLQFEFDTFETLADSEEYGGITYIQKLESLYEENSNIDYHVNVLKSDALKYHIKKKKLPGLQDIVEDPHSDVVSISKVVDEIKREVRENFSDTNTVLSGIELRKSWWQDYQERKKSSIFVPSGIKGLDRWMTEGLAKKKCSVWSARPGMGKTTTIANIILNLIRGIKNAKGEIISEPKKVILVPLETGHISYIDIMISILIRERLLSEEPEESAIPKSMIGLKLDRLVKFSDQITDQEDSLIQWAMKELFKNDNLVVSDDPYMTLDKLRLLLEDGVYDVCFIDLWEKLMDVKIEASSIADKLNLTQAIAKDCNVHMGIVHQIRRPPDGKGGKSKKNKIPAKPSIEMLKNSGGYEEVADLIVMMHRNKYYDPDIEEDVIEYIIGKQRRGAMNKSCFHEFAADYGQIGNYMKHYIEEAGEDVFGND